MTESKYFKPKSVTWWSSFVPLLAGAFLAFEPVHEWQTAIEVVNSMFGNVKPAVLINAGLAGIGLRGALG